jgi:hypothetical protein
MAGDGGQLLPVGQEDTLADGDSYYENAFASLFPRRVRLRVPKRVQGGDRARMQKMCDDLAAQRDSSDTFDAASLRRVQFEDLTGEDAQHPHVAFFRKACNDVNVWVGVPLPSHSAAWATR